MGKILCYHYESMADFETTFAYQILGCYMEKEIINMAYEKKPVRAASGIQYMPEVTVKEALSFDDVEAIVIPGGYVRECRDELIELIQKLYREEKLICAICAAPEFLARAGVLEYRQYTTTLGEDYFKKAGIEDVFPRSNYVEKLVVRDKNIITAKGRAFIDFGAEIGEYFGLFEDVADKDGFIKSHKE